MTAPVLDRLRAEGVEIAEGARAARVSGQAGAITVEAEDGRRFEGTHLLVALGRRPATDDMGLDAAGIDTDGPAIRVDACLRTTNRRAYAIGDVSGGMQFTHLAGYEAGIVLRAALFGLPARARHGHIPRVTYTDPELAHVGLTEAQARDTHGDGITVIREEFAANDRAVAAGQTAGGIKLIVHRGRPVGVTIVGAEAGELIALWAVALSKGLKLSDIAGAVLPYPTLSEIGKRAAGTYFSPRLFGNIWVKRTVRTIQRLVP